MRLLCHVPFRRIGEAKVPGPGSHDELFDITTARLQLNKLLPPSLECLHVTTGSDWYHAAQIALEDGLIASSLKNRPTAE
eukprot:5161936-Amphidinium_carterae.1